MKKASARKTRKPLKKSAKPRVQTGPKKRTTRNFPVVGIGGSAGCFSALQKFFTHMPSDSGMAFVIVVHLDPKHKGNVGELFSRYTVMPVVEALDGTKVQPDHVYVVPPNSDIGIHNKKLFLLSAAKYKGLRLPIDHFFQSLAEDQANKAVGIILSGMGTDGETGIRMIKEKLGMVMVQDPKTADYDSMPNSALSTNMVDYLLAPEEMPVRLVQYLNHPSMTDEPSDQQLLDSRDSLAIQKILMVLRSHTAHDFSLYKRNTITRRIDRRLAFHQLADYAQYLDFLREHPTEIQILFNELLIGVTKFFRDAAAFQEIKTKLTELIEEKAADDPIRVWVAGCSTGEEAYSIAILIAEFLDSIKGRKAPKVQIFATDLDANAIEHARHGIYLSNIVTDVTPDRIDRYFIKKHDSYQVKKELREMIVFAQHNLIKDAPFTRLDLLSCRNLLIYLTADLQKKIIPIFHYSLRPKGLLFLGPAETIGGFSELFSHSDSKWKIFCRKESSNAQTKMVDFPFHISKHDLPGLRAESAKGKKNRVQDSFNNLLLRTYSPAAILLSEQGEILYSNGRTSPYLELGSGEARMNISHMARQDLKHVLSNSIHRAKTSKGPVSVKELKVKHGNETRLVNITVTPLSESPMEGMLLVLFEDAGKPGKKKQQATGKKSVVMEELEKELAYTKQELHSTIEQMETSVEELKSTNEELQSTNEELQSTNEESLTTKEEMQSLNEELMTINLQYQLKGEELTQVNNDMKNLLDNTEIGTVFLDNNLEILRFTPQVVKLFNLIQTDIGRSINHVVSNFDCPDLTAHVKEVIETLRVKELQIRTKKDEWFNLRIMPYRTLDNFIGGAVLTFHNITYLKVLEERFNMVQKGASILVNSMKEPAALLDQDLKIIIANKAFLQRCDIEPGTESEKRLDRLLDLHLENNTLLKLLKKGKKSGAAEHEIIRFNNQRLSPAKLVAKQMTADEDGNGLILVVLEELK